MNTTIKAEIEVDHQHGPIVRLTVNNVSAFGGSNFVAGTCSALRAGACERVTSAVRFAIRGY